MKNKCECPFCCRETEHLIRSDEFGHHGWCQECLEVHPLEEDHAIHIHFTAHCLTAKETTEVAAVL